MRSWRSVLCVVVVGCGTKPAVKNTSDGAAPVHAATAQSASAPSGPERPVAPPTDPGALKAKRPPWITSDAPDFGTCTDLGGRLDCVGVSAFLESRDAARPAAATVALDAMSLYIAREARALREKRPATPDDKTAVSGAAVTAARAKIEAALHVSPGTPPAPTDWYWEEYAKLSGPGTEFLAFARVVLSADAHAEIAQTLATAK